MARKPENAAGEQRGRPFQPGQSGNPAGKPKGTRHRLTLLAEKMMEDEAADVVRAVLEAAKDGDMGAARLVMERVSPVRKGRPVAFDLPAVTTAADVLTALGAVLQAVAEGALTPDEAACVAGLLEAKRKAIETVAIEQRLAALENREFAK